MQDELQPFRMPPDRVDFMYGNFPGGDPRDFVPDGQTSTPGEIARWFRDCVRVEILERRGTKSLPFEPGSGYRFFEGLGWAHAQWERYGHGIYWAFYDDFDTDGGGERLAMTG